MKRETEPIDQWFFNLVLMNDLYDMDPLRFGDRGDLLDVLGLESFWKEEIELEEFLFGPHERITGFA